MSGDIPEITVLFSVGIKVNRSPEAETMSSNDDDDWRIYQ